MPAELHPTTVLLLDDLPPFEQSAPEIQGTIDVIVRELERVQDAIATAQKQYLATTADELLTLWESELDLPVAPADQATEQRRQRVLAYLRSLYSGGSGLDWEAALTDLIGTGWTYEEHDPDNLSSPPIANIRITVPFGGALDPPSGLTATPGSGGSLSAGDYVYVVTATNSYGETTPSSTVTATVGASGKVTLDWSDDVGATGYKVYRGPDSSHLRRIATITTPASNYVDDGTETASIDPPPSVNTSQSLQAFEVARLARRITPAHLQIEYGYSSGFIVGISTLGEFL